MENFLYAGFLSRRNTQTKQQDGRRGVVVVVVQGHPLLLEAVGIVVSMCKYLEEDDTAMMQTFFVTGGADSLEQLLALGGSSFWPCYW